MSDGLQTPDARAKGEAEPAARIQAEPLETLIPRAVPNPKGCGIYLCGAPEFVQALRKRLFLAGAAMADIHTDAFLPAVAAAS